MIFKKEELLFYLAFQIVVKMLFSPLNWKIMLLGSPAAAFTSRVLTRKLVFAENLLYSKCMLHLQGSRGFPSSKVYFIPLFVACTLSLRVISNELSAFLSSAGVGYHIMQCFSFQCRVVFQLHQKFH